MMRPSPLALPATRDFGTVRIIATASANNAASITLPQRPVGREFWLIAAGCGSASYGHVVGAEADASQVGEQLYIMHQGATSWQTVKLSTHRALPGATFPSALNLNFGASTSARMAYGLLLRPRGDFRMRPMKQQASSTASAVSSFTVTPAGAAMQRPGGLWVAAAYQTTNGPTSVSGEGWAGYFVGNLGLAIWIAPTGYVALPPPVVFTAGGNERWATVCVGLR